jgi:hypothetical protein
MTAGLTTTPLEQNTTTRTCQRPVGHRFTWEEACRGVGDSTGGCGGWDHGSRDNLDNLVGYPHFSPDTNLDSNIIKYECKMNSLNSNSHYDIYSIYR